MNQFILGNTGIDPLIKTPNDRVPARFGHLNKIVDAVTALQEVPPGSGIESVTGSAVDNTDPLNPVVNIPTGYLPLEGGTMDSGATIDFVNGSKLKQGTTNQEKGGNNGISFKCSLDYELKWEAGRLYIMEQDGATIRESLYNFNNIPSVDDDAKSGYTVGTRWKLDDGTTYICTQAGQGSADWVLEANNISGTYTPTIDNTNNNAIANVSGNAFYTIINGLVTVTFDIHIDFLVTTTSQFTFDLPIPPVVPFSSGDTKSIISSKNYINNNLSIASYGNIANENIKNEFTVLNTQSGLMEYTISITYFS